MIRIRTRLPLPGLTRMGIQLLALAAWLLGFCCDCRYLRQVLWNDRHWRCCVGPSWEAARRMGEDFKRFLGSVVAGERVRRQEEILKN